MNTIKRLLLSGFVVFLAACNQSVKMPGKENAAAEPDAFETSHGSLSLNQGEKWQVNAEMKPYVEQGDSLVGTYLLTGLTDYRQLASQLREYNSRLIASCTMKGAAHEELHKWLHPHLELVKALGKAANRQEADAYIQSIRSSYDIYRGYFQ